MSKITQTYPYYSLGITSVTTAGTPVAVANLSNLASTKVRAVYLSAIKAKGTANTGTNMYVLDPSGSILFVIPKAVFPVRIAPREAGQADFIDLSTWEIDADTSADGLAITVQL